jgi:hypothetical protein
MANDASVGSGSINDQAYSSQTPASAQVAPSAASALNLKGMSIPDEMRNPTVKQLNQEHPEYTDKKDTWIKMSMLYEGGSVIKKNCTQFLIRRPRELQEVYQARVDRFTYHNILGTCFGWYRAAMFKNPPNVRMVTVGKDEQPDGSDLAKDIDAWYIAFRKNCDRKKTTLVDLMREVWTSLALYRTSYVLLDLPAAPDAKNRADQRKAGVLDSSGKPSPYAVTYSPVSVINWDVDTYGNLTWAVIAYQDQARGFVQTSKIVDTWLYFDREKFIRYERERKPGETDISKLDENDRATITAAGPHALSKQNAVPLLKFEVPDGLWLTNRAYLPVMDHLNQDNSLGWALYISNLAMPVVTSDTDIKPQLSEAGFIQLPTGATYAWSEPEGKSFAISAQRVGDLRQEIFRAMYLSYQGKSSSATADGASGVSKEMDMMPAQDVMNEYGDVVIASMQRLLDMVAQARGDVSVRADVRGLKFGKTATIEQVQLAEAVLAIGTGSETFEKEVKKQLASDYLPDANPETLEKISDEIDAAPTDEEKAQQDAKTKQMQYSASLAKTVSAFNAPPQPPLPAGAPPQKKAKKGAAALTD